MADHAPIMDAPDSAPIRMLIAAKRQSLVPMTIIFMVSYIGVTILAGFAKSLMATKIFGPVNLGFVLIAANYVLAWVLAIVYARVANNTFDPLAAKAAAAVKQSEAMR